MKKNKQSSPLSVVSSQSAGAGEPMQITQIPLASIKPDPNQPRKVFDPEKLQELADSIRAVGIQQPLRVQLVPAKFRIQEPDLTVSDYTLLKWYGDRWNEQDRCDEKNVKLLRETWAGNFGGNCTLADYEEFYQIIFGERRWRAAALAGLDTLPCIVGDISDKDRFVLQFIENNARENLSALEEAGAFERQIADRKKTDATFNADRLAEELGIGRATVYGRLKLTRLHQPVRDALIAGKISTSVAGSIAIIPDPKKQEELLEKLTDEHNYRFGSSARDVEEWIEDEFVKQLDGAPFKSGRDEAPLYDAQGGALPLCRDCPHRSGNMKEQFPELAKRPNVCTNPECYGQKLKAHWVQVAADEQAAGKKVLTAKEFKAAKGTLVKATDRPNWGATWEMELGKKAPEPVLVATQEGLVKYYPKDEAVAAAKAKGVKLPKEAQPQTAEDKAKEEASRKEREERMDRREKLVIELLPKLAKCLEKVKDKDAWEMMSKGMGEMDGYCWHVMEDLVDHTKSAKAATLARLLSDEEQTPLDHQGDWKKDGLAQWKELGVDLIAEEKALENEAPALPLTKAEAKQKQLLTVPAKKRGRGRPPGAKNKKGVK